MKQTLQLILLTLVLLSITACSLEPNAADNQLYDIPAGGYPNDPRTPPLSASTGSDTVSSHSDASSSTSNPSHDAASDRFNDNDSAVTDTQTDSSPTSGARAVVSITSSGDAIIHDPDTGVIKQRHRLFATDVLTHPQYHDHIVFSSSTGDYYTQLSTFHWSEQELSLLDCEELSTMLVYLIHGPEPVMGLSISDDTALFCGDDGYSVFPVGSFSSISKGNTSDVWLLQRERQAPQLSHYHLNGSIKRMSNVTTKQTSWSSYPKLIRGASHPLIAGTIDNSIEIQDLDGNIIGSWKVDAMQSLSVQDALWLAADTAQFSNNDDLSRKIAIMTGPYARLYIVDLNDPSFLITRDSHVLIGNSSSPSRRIAFDPRRERLWLALSKGLFSFHMGSDKPMQPMPIGYRDTAETVEIIW